MQKLSGLVLDVRDDFDGSVLREIFPSADALPELVKSAAAVTPELDVRLPDNLFALVLVDGDVSLRKFACIDAGNTALSVEYFLKTGHKLPLEAQKTAAANLVQACAWYDIEPPSALEKIALGLGTALNVAMTAPGTVKKTRMNLAATPPGMGVITPNQREQMLKGGEAAGTNLMPNSQPTLTGVAPKTVIRKVAATMSPHKAVRHFPDALEHAAGRSLDLSGIHRDPARSTVKTFRQGAAETVGHKKDTAAWTKEHPFAAKMPSTIGLGGLVGIGGALLGGAIKPGMGHLVGGGIGAGLGGLLGYAAGPTPEGTAAAAAQAAMAHGALTDVAIRSAVMDRAAAKRREDQEEMQEKLDDMHDMLRQQRRDNDHYDRWGKYGSAGFVGDRGIDAGAAKLPDDNMGKATGAKQPPRLPQASALKPHVNVAGKEAPGQLILKKAEFWAMPSLERYPLDDYGQVKAASEYFDEWHGQMSPEHRREYSVNMVKRAKALRIPVGPVAERYASAGYAPDHDVQAAIDGRKLAMVDDVLINLLDKLADARPHLSPDQFAVTLAEFDKVAGIDHLYDQHVVDPYYSTFGEKRASDSIAVGNDIMYVKDLKRFAKVGFNTMKTRFGDDMANEFVKDPVGIFNSLPTDQKKVIMRIASDNSATDGENLGGVVSGS